jgi:hypothetical protein
MRREGFRRLSILLGAFGAVGWSVFVVIASEAFHQMSAGDWIVAVVGLLVTFLVPMLAVRGAAWVLDGFKGGS